MITDYSTKKLTSLWSRIFGIRFLYYWLIVPRSDNEDRARKEYVLNLILVGTLLLLSILGISLITSFLHPEGSYSGISLLFFLTITLFTGMLLLLSRKGFVTWGSYLTVGLYTTLSLLGVIQWTFIVPMIILSIFLSIVISGLLISTRFAFRLTFFFVISIAVITHFQSTNTIPVNIYWQYDSIGVQDVIDIGFILILTSGLTWISNREVERSLARARKSEAALEHERILLEENIAKRVAELAKIEEEKSVKLQHFAKIGELSTGIFHDLMTPLSGIIASIDSLEKDTTDIQYVKNYIEKAVSASKKLGEDLGALKKVIREDSTLLEFRLIDVFNDVETILRYKSRKSHVSIITPNTNLLLYGNQTRFYQVILNLVSNAIDSYLENQTGQRTVTLQCSSTDRFITIFIIDNGSGMPPSVRNKIFDRFYSTKKSSGTGIGLFNSKKIIEEDFSGTISVDSTMGIGTTFLISIPKIKTGETRFT